MMALGKEAELESIYNCLKPKEDAKIAKKEEKEKIEGNIYLHYLNKILKDKEGIEKYEVLSSFTKDNSEKDQKEEKED